MTALIVTPPSRRFRSPTQSYPSIFLAGSIEMGAAEDWQAKAIEMLSPNASVIYNPRRPDWDSSWEQEIGNPEFNGQVNWELDMIEQANYVLMYFDPATKAPISLMELGYCGAIKPAHTYVVCPEGYWRKGNVDILCERTGIRQFADLKLVYHLTATLFRKSS